MSRSGAGERAIWWTGLACATGAVGLGLAYLSAAGAPLRMIAMNAAAVLVGLAAYATVAGPQWRIERVREWILPLLGSVLLATALASVPVAGAARWLAIGPLVLQVSLLLLPAMLVLFAGAPSAGGVIGLAIAASALALQPDRAMAGALAAGLAVLAVRRRERLTLTALAAAVAAFAVTLVRPDRLPAVPFVDQVFYSAFDVHLLAGAAVLIGTGLLLTPALVRARQAEGRDAAATFGALWAAIAVAAALGNYPTPVVGYGGSAIVGYLLSLAVLRPVAKRAGARRAGAVPAGDDGDGRSLSASLA